MVLDPLGIPLSRFFWKAKDTQERDNQAVAPSRHVGQTASGFGQEDRSVRAVLDQTIALQPGYGTGYRRMRDPKALANIDGTCRAVGGDQIGDQFDIVFCRLGPAGGAGLAETFSWPTQRYRRHRGIGLHGRRSPSARDAAERRRHLI